MVWKNGEKDKAADLATAKKSLFGKLKDKSSKSSASPTPTSTSANPYAAAPQTNTNPYATHNVTNDPYAPKSQSSLTQPPTSSFGSLTLNSQQGGPPGYARSVTPTNRPEKSPVPPGGYGGAAPRYPAQGGSAQAGGYGGDAYGNGQSRYGASGYGGLGRSNSQDTVSTDVARGTLFGDAPQRAQQQQQQQQQTFAPEQPSDPSYSNSGGYDSAEMPGGYGAGPDRELTAEEIEDQDVHTAKSEIRFIKQQDVASTRNARRIAEQAEQTGRETLERLGAQGDRIHNTERNLDLASINNRHAEEKARELRTLNRSMWAVHVANPFTKDAKHERKIHDELEKRQLDRREQQHTREAAYGTQARHQAQQRDINGNAVRPGKSSLADRAKYQFEADSEDEEMENEIEGNLDAIGSSVRMLKNVSQAMNGELTSQNAHIDRIAGKTDKVDDGIAMNRARLDAISKRG
ncbi:hypothetical protein LTR36_003250 [Oleoguttula mirabilis]|uniref:t-SNARE coiled-coil homology domain-containing protein n=1 Tax=Oleoguttula mirabilis TaxID=1507867 RepID=A0AAV9JXD4_9PEZI|nr:hypothetical protein LTR36_003250 [Oleoguttula mirabilis]